MAKAKVKTKAKSKVDNNIYYCVGCGKIHPKSNFYISYNQSHANGCLYYCKDFIKESVYLLDNTVNVDKFKKILRQLDIPFLDSIYQPAVDSGSDIVGSYFRMFNSLSQNRGTTWENSDFEVLNAEKGIESDEKPSGDIVNVSNKRPSDLTKNEIITLEQKWGFGYDTDEYILFEKKWDKLIGNYGRKTAMHVEGLKTYIRFRVKEELATAKGNVKEAKEWGGLASKAATDAKINVSQLSKSDISGGIDVLPQLFEAVESELGIIPQLPQLMAQPYDDADMIIWANTNYMRRLEGKSRVPYRDIWDFYDEMIDEHSKQIGLSPKEIEEFKDKRKVPYRDMGTIYIDPVYDDGDV